MTDIKHTEDGDLDLSGGDLAYAVSDVQHRKDILLSRKGDYKEHPALGVDAADYVNETDPEGLLRTIRKEFTSDGMRVTKVSLNARGELETDAHYENS